MKSITTPYRLIALLLMFPFWLVAQKSTPLQLTDIFDMEYVSEPQVSPDGSRIVYVRHFKDIMTDRNLSNLWIVNSDGSGNRPLTTGNHVVGSPRWSHDGSKLAFSSNLDDDKMKLYLMWMDTREMVALTNTSQTPGGPEWSPDDRFLAFGMFVQAVRNAAARSEHAKGEICGVARPLPNRQRHP